MKTDSKVTIPCDRHRMKIPMLGWVRWKEKGWIPTDSSIYIIKSGAVTCKAVSVFVEQPEQVSPQLKDIGLGIDLGVKDFAVIRRVL